MNFNLAFVNVNFGIALRVADGKNAKRIKEVK